MSINPNIPAVTAELTPRIHVIGVGGAGGNAINNMISSGLEGVQFISANTDAQALAMASSDYRIQMGVELTEGLGAGSSPDIGRRAAEEAIDEIRDRISGVHMVFIAAGMGGGTGTGAAPVIAAAGRELGVLTVGVVTKPFFFEGQRRMDQALAGIKELEKHVDTLIVIPNQNLFCIANENTTFAEAFRLADQVLHAGISCITDLIVKEGLINLDFADVRAVMNEMGSAMMGTGEAQGEKRALEAAEEAIANPLLDEISLEGAKGLLISITGGNDLTLYEVDEAAARVRQMVAPDANVIIGATFEEKLEGRIRVSVVASGVSSRAKEEPAPSDRLTERLTTSSSSEQNPPELSQVTEDKDPSEQTDRIKKAEENHVLWEGPGEVKIEQRPPQLALQSPTAKTPSLHAAKPDFDPKSPDFAPAPPITAKHPPRRLPELEEFPVVGQKKLRASGARSHDVGLMRQKKKIGFFERLAGIGRAKPQNDPLSKNLRQKPQVSHRDLRQGPPAGPLAASSKKPVNKLAQSPRTPPPLSGPEKAPKERLRNTPVETLEDIEIPEFFRRKSN